MIGTVVKPGRTISVVDELKARHSRQRAGSRTFRPYFKPRVA